jgi:DNA-binding CsgD family transcriptional regulator
MRPATVYTHVRNAVHKLNVSSRTQAVVIAARYEYLSESPRQS